MTDAERERLIRRYVDIKGQLNALRAGRVVDGDPAEVEAALQSDCDEIVIQLGADHAERRDAE